MSPFSRDRQPFDLTRMLGPFQPALASARDPACAVAVLCVDARRRVAALPAA
jgi:hypothetical protein